MIVIERRNKIKEILLEERSVKVNELAALFDVSEETIRRDLTALEKEGLVKKNYGGAVLVEDLIDAMHHTRSTSGKCTSLKKRKKAASLLQPGERVLIDAPPGASAT